MSASASPAGMILHTAYTCLTRIEREGLPLDDVLDDLPGTLPRAVRNGVAHLLFAYFREAGRVRAFMTSEAFKCKAPVRRLLGLSVIQIHRQQGIPLPIKTAIAVDFARTLFSKNEAGFLNFALRRAAECDFDALPNPYPAALLEARKTFLSESECRQLEQVEHQEPPFTVLRLADHVPADDEGLIPLVLPFAPENTYFQVTRPGDFLRSPTFDSGAYYVQDPAPMHMVSLLARNGFSAAENVLDLCAAPGGKSLLLARFFKIGTLVANDRSARRQERTAENFKRCGAQFDTAFACTVHDGLNPDDFSRDFDWVVLDVPCSNTGVYRHRPDAVWTYSSERVRAVLPLQRDLLETGSRCVKRGGVLVYGTCSLEPDENERQIAAFLQSHPAFSLLDSAVLYPDLLHDGAYCALLKRED